MKLAEIEDPSKLSCVREYANKHNFNMHEIISEVEEVSNVAKLVNECIAMAQKKRCSEFCVHEIRYRYNIMEDTHTWKISIFGFMDKVKA